MWLMPLLVGKDEIRFCPCGRLGTTSGRRNHELAALPDLPGMNWPPSRNILLDRAICGGEAGNRALPED
jgi:hypothetical protein